MARIRTIKPDFWTDSKLILLPIHVRLLFVGLWQMADDWGALEDEPERIKMVVYPNDDVDVWEALEHLSALALIERFVTPEGDRIIYIPKFSKHQKIDKRSAKRYMGEGKWRKATIPTESRRRIAEVFGCKPGDSVPAECYYCGQPGTIHWNAPKRNGIGWITFGCLELDHFIPELDGGISAPANIVLACRNCNRNKGAFEDGYSYISRKLEKANVLVDAYPKLEGALDIYCGKKEFIPRRETPHNSEPQPIPPNPPEPPREKGLERKGKEMEGKGEEVSPKSQSIPPDLHELQYAAKIIEDLELVSTHKLIEIVGSAVVTASKRNKISKSQGFEWLRKRALDARSSGVPVNRFWFEDADKWELKHGNDDGIAREVVGTDHF